MLKFLEKVLGRSVELDESGGMFLHKEEVDRINAAIPSSDGKAATPGTLIAMIQDQTAKLEALSKELASLKGELLTKKEFEEFKQFGSTPSTDAFKFYH